MAIITESIVEDATLEWLQGLGYSIQNGPLLAVGEMFAERTDPNFRDTILEKRLREALDRLNPQLPPEAIEDAFRKLIHIDAPSLIERNRAFHRLLVNCVTVEYRRKDGSIAGTQAWVIDFEEPDNNDWRDITKCCVWSKKKKWRMLNPLNFGYQQNQKEAYAIWKILAENLLQV